MPQTFTWIGPAQGDWFTATDWSPDGPPATGDTAVIDDAAGPAIGGTGTPVDEIAILLTAHRARLFLNGGTVGPGGSVASAAPGGGVNLVYSGTAAFGGTLGFAPSVVHSTVYIDGDATGTLTVDAMGTMAAIAGTSVILSTGTVVNNGTLQAVGGLVSLYSGAIAGNGTLAIGQGGHLYSNIPIGSGQTVAFTDQTGLLELDDVALAGTIAGFRAGNMLMLDGITADSATYDAATQTLNVTDDGTIVASFHLLSTGAPLQFATRFSELGESVNTLITSSDVTRAWNGGTGNWYVAANWTTTLALPESFPLAGDTVRINSGLVTIGTADVARYGTIDAQRIILNGASGAPGGLFVTDDTIGPNAVIETTGQDRFGLLRIGGTVTLNGLVNSQARAGRLTIDLANDGTLVNGINGSILSSTPAGLVFDGDGTFVNNGIVVAQGGLHVGAGVTFTNDGYATSGIYNVVRLQHGGRATIEGTFENNAIEFGDASGYLTIANLAGFQGAVWNMDGGNRIDLPNLVIGSVSYDLDADLLSLFDNAGSQVGEITILTADGQAGFAVAADGIGGSVISYAPARQLLQPALPVPLVASPGTTVALSELLIQAFGTIPAAYAGSSIGLSFADTQDLRDWNFSYWNLSHPATTSWLHNGTILPSLPFDAYLPPVPPTVVYGGDEIGNVTLQAGNAIMPNILLSIPVAGPPGDPTASVVYWIPTIDPAVASPTINDGIVDPDDIVASAQRFADYYVNVPNSNDCGWIADAVAAAAGASMPQLDQSTDPSANQPGGFWRVAYRGSDHDHPVQDWSSLVRAGDVVRMAWADGFYGQHTTTVLARNDDGTIRVYDNMDIVAGIEGSVIGIHDAAYWTDTLAASITIYRLDPNNQYLVAGSSNGEYLQGSTYDNLFQPGGGADTMAGGTRNDEFRDTAANLNGDSILEVNAGDRVDVTDLSPDGARAGYDPSTGMLTIGNAGSITVSLNLPAGLGFTFDVSADATGGTQVTVACFASGTRLRTAAGDVAVERLAVGDRLLTAQDGVLRPIRWIGRRGIALRRHSRPLDVQPIRIAPHAFGPGLPARALVLSPDHALYLDGVLIPVRYLVDEHHITRLDRDHVTYWHVELDRHDVVLAEGLAVESYLDTGDRGGFVNGGKEVRLFPDFASGVREAKGFAPLVVTGPKIEAVRRRLARHRYSPRLRTTHGGRDR